MADNTERKSTHYSSNGVDKRLARRLQKSLGLQYTKALRLLEDINPEARRAFVEETERNAALA